MIKLINVNKNYDLDSNFTLQNINLDIDKGGIFSIVGRSGTGKTTILNLISGMIKPDSGTVLFEGKDINTLQKADKIRYRQQIGFIFQNANLLNNLTVEANILLPLKLQKVSKEIQENKVKEILELVGLTDKAKDYPHMLSGGQKQRVGIARALITNPSLLLCDEITASLDSQTSQNLLDLLLRIKNERDLTIVFISHDLLIVKSISDQVAILDNGVLSEVIKMPKERKRTSIIDIKELLLGDKYA